MERRIAKFEKVSKEQFCKDMIDAIPQFWKTELELGNTIEQSYKKLERIWEDLQIPKRATTGSAGYDFGCTMNVDLAPGESMKIPTGIRCKFFNDEWLLGLFPRSGLGFKYREMLANTVGIVDCDYYYSDNEGHIMAKIYNGGKETLKLREKENFIQGIFFLYGLAEEEEVTETRNGGFGSTDN